MSCTHPLDSPAPTSADIRPLMLENAVDRDAAVGDGRVNARQVLQNNPSGAKIHMSDFGISHLAVRQADVML